MWLPHAVACEFPDVAAQGADGQVNHAMIVNTGVVDMMVPAGVDVDPVAMQ